MEVIRCDRCGAIIENKRVMNRITCKKFTEPHYGAVMEEETWIYNEKDLCPKCFKDYIDFMKFTYRDL